MESWVVLALPGAVAYASSLLGDRSRGEDVVQDCVCRLLDGSARYDLARDGRKLLFRAITNACINLQSREREIVSLDELGRGGEDAPWEVEDATAASPLMVVISEELRQAIVEGLAALPIRQRSALELSGLGYRNSEIAEILTVDLDHVRVLLFRARRTMATFLNTRFSEGVTP